MSVYSPVRYSMWAQMPNTTSERSVMNAGDLVKDRTPFARSSPLHSLKAMTLNKGMMAMAAD